MRRIYFPAIAGIVLAGAVAAQASETVAAPDVTVWVHSEVVSTPGVISRAKQLTKEIFESVGVNVAFADQAARREQGVFIRLDVEAGRDAEGAALGTAMPFARGHVITVNYDAVRRSAGISKQLEPIILGHVFVHEITHILQGVNRHSDTGMMKARWTPEDYCEMEWKPLEFTREDVELIRLGMDVLRGHGGQVEARATDSGK